MAAPPTPNSKVLLKILIIGEAGVGKTSLVLRYTDPTWDPKSTPPTNGADTIPFDTKIDGRDVRLQIWDTAGQEKFRVITSTFYKGAHGVLAVYDTTSRETFETIPSWFGEVTRYCQAKVARVIIGNKTDLKDQRQVPTEEGQNTAKSTAEGAAFVETSAFDLESVQNAFLQVAKLALAEHDNQMNAQKVPKSPSSNGVVLKPGTVFKVDPTKENSSSSLVTTAAATKEEKKPGCCVLL